MTIQPAGLAVAAEAMSRIQESVGQSAVRLAAAGTPSASSPSDTLDLSAEMVALLQARNQMAVVTEVAQTMDELAGQTLNILA